MSSDGKQTLWLLVVTFALAFSMGCFVGSETSRFRSKYSDQIDRTAEVHRQWMESIKDLRQQAIDHGFAEYNSTNGVWQWKEAK